MSDRGIAQLLSFLKRQTGENPDLVPDGDLLARYLANNDQAAFELLVRRHGAMVLGVARRVLRDTHAAEDVFQAAFLTLARKANSLRQHAALAGWLYRVTLRIALRAQPALMRRASSLKWSDHPTESPIASEWSELRQVLDQEINKLPGRFRMAIVLCYLSGKSTEDAAVELGCPRGTVLSRLASARKRLRVGLTRRGFAVSSAALAAGLTSETAPAGLNSTWIALAMNVIKPAAAISPAVASLSYGVIHAMMMTNIKVALCLVLITGGIGIGVGQLGGPTPVTADDQPVQTKSKMTQPNDNDLIAQKRVEERRRLAETQMIEMLKASSHDRIKSKVTVMELEDRIDEIRQNMVPISKMLDEYLALRLSASMKLHGLETSRGDEAQVKEHREAVAYLDNAINEVRSKLQTHRAEMRKMRRELLEAEETLSLQEKINNIEMNRISRTIKP